MLLVCSSQCTEKLVSAETEKWYRMEDLCGSRIDMAKDGVYTAVIKFHGVAVTQICVLSVSPGSWWNKLSFQVTKHSNGGDSCLTFSQKVEGSKKTQGIPGLYGKYCGYDQPPTKQQFDVDELHLNYTPQSIHIYFYLTFEIVVTVFKEGECDAYQCDNKRCIPQELECSAYNPCGDSSDCHDVTDDRGLSLAKLIGIVVGVTVGAVLTMCAFKRCFSNEESVDRESDPGDSPLDLEIQSLYSTENRTGAPSYDTLDHARGQRDFSQENINLSIGSSAETNARASSPVQSLIHTAVSPERHNRTDGIELHVPVEQDSNVNSEEIANSVDGEIAEQLPPPSYESVMANEEIYKISH